MRPGAAHYPDFVFGCFLCLSALLISLQPIQHPVLAGNSQDIVVAAENVVQRVFTPRVFLVICKKNVGDLMEDCRRYSFAVRQLVMDLRESVSVPLYGAEFSY